MEARCLILVEGASDRVALETLAARVGRDLRAEGVEVVELGGATNVAKYLAETVRGGEDLQVLGLYDDAEERFFAHGLERAGLGPVEDRGRLEQLGFFACVADLEDELIRAVGEHRMLQVIDHEGELASLRRLQRQPVQRTWPQHHQLRRFLSARSGHKSRYARLLVEALDLSRVPRPLAEALTRAGAARGVAGGTRSERQVRAGRTGFGAATPTGRYPIG